MGFWHAYMGIYGGGGTAPSTPVTASDLHYTIPAQVMHYTIPEQSTEYTVPNQ